jgi:hypothetical protein
MYTMGSNRLGVSSDPMKINDLRRIGSPQQTTNNIQRIRNRCRRPALPVGPLYRASGGMGVTWRPRCASPWHEGEREPGEEGHPGWRRGAMLRF